MELRPDQHAVIEHHDDIVGHVIAGVVDTVAAGERSVTEAIRTALHLPDDLLVSVAVCAVVAEAERHDAWRDRIRDGSGVVRLGAGDVAPALVLRALRRRKLPWCPDDVDVMLDRSAGSAVNALAFAVAAAERVLASTPGEPKVLAALDRAGPALDACGLHRAGEAGRVRQRIRALVAANAPGGLLDLGVLEPGDEWAPRAAKAAERQSTRWDGVQALLALLAGVRGSRPTPAWLRRAQPMTAPAPARALLQELLELVSVIGPVPAAGWPPEQLLARGNERLLQGAAWACGTVDESWVVPLLGPLARRCAATSSHPRVGAPVAHRLATGCIEGLVALGTEEARAELASLARDLGRCDLVRRIESALRPASSNAVGSRSKRRTSR